MTQKDSKCPLLMKILVIGDSGVGKTNILMRFCQDEMNVNHLPTIGIDFKIKQFEVDGQKVKMQIWDTAGQERFRTITQSYYKGANGIILVYAINDSESYSNIVNWVKQIQSYASDDVQKVLVGNKVDLEDERQVQNQEGVNLAQQLNIPFYETSAQANINIQKLFQQIARQIKANSCQGSDDQTGLGVSVVKNKDNQTKKGDCC